MMMMIYIYIYICKDTERMKEIVIKIEEYEQVGQRETVIDKWIDGWIDI